MILKKHAQLVNVELEKRYSAVEIGAINTVSTAIIDLVTSDNVSSEDFAMVVGMLKTLVYLDLISLTEFKLIRAYIIKEIKGGN